MRRLSDVLARLGLRPELAQAVLDAAGASGGAAGEVVPSTVRFAVPSSDLFPFDLFHARRALVGGTLSRAWVSFDVGATTYALHFRHNGSGADPTVHVPALAGATAVEADLGSVARTSAEVAAIVIAALDGVGVSVTTDGTDDDGRTVCVVQGGSSLVIPPAVNTADTSLRGMWGLQRDDWGAGTAAQPNQNGGTGGTGSIHLGSPGAALGRTGRVLGVYLWAHTGHAPRLAASSGPAYSASPGAMTILGEAVADPITGFGGALFEPAEFAASDVLWAHYREDAAGGPRFRAHGETVVGNGNLGVGEVLVWDTAASASSATAFGESYSPTASSTFNLYIAIGVIFELQDASGNYAARGEIATIVGDQNTDDEHGTQFAAGPELLDLETTHHRIALPQWTNFRATRVSRAMDAIGAGEGSRCAMYQWSDLDVPSTGTHPLVADLGVLELVADAYGETVLATPVELGTEVLGANAIVSCGFNYATESGVAISTLTLPVFIDAALGDGSYLNCWVDDRETWHDYIPGASGIAPTSGVVEYRTVGGASTMPVDDLGHPWPHPFDVDPSDDSPAALALDRIRWERAGLVAA